MDKETKEDFKTETINDEGIDSQETKSSSSNIIPMDKLKGGLDATGKFFSSSFSFISEKTGEGVKSIKESDLVTKHIPNTASFIAEKTSETAKNVKESDLIQKHLPAAGETIKRGSLTAWEKTKEGTKKAGEVITPLAISAGQSISSGAVATTEAISKAINKK